MGAGGVKTQEGIKIIYVSVKLIVQYKFGIRMVLRWFGKSSIHFVVELKKRIYVDYYITFRVLQKSEGENRLETTGAPRRQVLRVTDWGRGGGGGYRYFWTRVNSWMRFGKYKYKGGSFWCIGKSHSSPQNLITRGRGEY